MKHILTICKDGKKVIRRTLKKMDWDFLEKEYQKLLDQYYDQDYINIESSSSGDESYDILFNKELMKSVVLSYTYVEVSDFKDADGEPIILGKTYTGVVWYPEEDTEGKNDEYFLEMSPWEDEGLYIRNTSKTGERSIQTNNGCRMAKTCPDVSGSKLTQEYIDSLKLHRK